MIYVLKTKPDKLYLNGFGSYVGREEGCLVVRDRERNETHYPLVDNEIKEIQIRSGNTISSGALTTCGYWNIDLIVLTGRGHPVAVLKSLYDDSHVETRVSQYKALENGKAPELAKTIVISKIEGQNQLLKKYGMKQIDFSVIQSIKKLPTENYTSLRRKLTGLEGRSAYRYFKQILDLFQESIRPECRKKFKAFDGVNNLFNLGYKILSSKVHIALIKAKLVPSLFLSIYLWYTIGKECTQTVYTLP